jgi:glutamate synthase (NADPH/NADH) small chain
MNCGIPYCHNGCPVNNQIPDWNHLVYEGDWREALDNLHSTNNFPEFTGRICPAPCEAACTLNIVDQPVTIKSIECAIVDKGWKEGWIEPQVPAKKTGKSVAVVGSGPAGMAAAQQLARAGHSVTVFEKSIASAGCCATASRLQDGKAPDQPSSGADDGRRRRFPHFGGSGRDRLGRLAEGKLRRGGLAGGAEDPRPIGIPGFELPGVRFAMEFLTQQNKRVAGDDEIRAAPRGSLTATGKHVVVIGGGDTGSDCVGTSNRQGALSVTQLEIMPRRPKRKTRR